MENTPPAPVKTVDNITAAAEISQPPVASVPVASQQPVVNPPPVVNLPAVVTCAQNTNSTNSVPNTCANVVTIPVPIVPNEETYTYITVKGSLHDRTCAVFGLNDMEIQALSKRFNSVKGAVNGVMVSVPPMEMVNTLAQLSYKVVCSCGEAEISWTMQREI